MSSQIWWPESGINLSKSGYKHQKNTQEPWSLILISLAKRVKAWSNQNVQAKQKHKKVKARVQICL